MVPDSLMTGAPRRAMFIQIWPPSESFLACFSVFLRLRPCIDYEYFLVLQNYSNPLWSLPNYSLRTRKKRIKITIKSNNALKKVHRSEKLMITFCRGWKAYEDVLRLSGRPAGAAVSSGLRHQGDESQLREVQCRHLQPARDHWLECQLYGTSQSQDPPGQVRTHNSIFKQSPVHQSR